MKRSFVCFTAISLVLFLFSSCGSKSRNLPTQKDADSGSEEGIHVTREEVAASGMNFLALKKVEVVEKVEVSGYIRALPQSQVLVSSLVGGHVRKVYVREGEWVKQGAPLLQIEDPAIVEMQQMYLEAHSTIASLEADYQRQKQLAQENIASEKSLLKAQSEYMSALARVAGLKCKIKMLGVNMDKVESAQFVTSVVINAPIEGGIAGMAVKEGMYLSPESEALEIINPQNVYLELNVFEKEVFHLKKGGAVRFRISEWGENWQSGNILFVGQQVRDESRTVSVQVRINKTDFNLLPGMFVEAEILLPEGLMDTLPQEAVVEMDGKEWAFLQTDEDPQGFILKRVEVISRMGGDGNLTILNADDFKEGSLFLSKGGDQFIGE